MNNIEDKKEVLLNYKKIIAKHPTLMNALNDTINAIPLSGGDEDLIFIIGPSGVGKKALKNLLDKELINRFNLQNNIEGMIPFVQIEAPAVGNRGFDWKDFNTRTLLLANEPLIDKKVDYDKIYSGGPTGNKLILPSNNNNNSELRRSVENMLKYRKPMAFIIDEGEHFGMVSSGSSLQDQITILKSLANISRVPIIILGTYDMLSFIKLSSQLIRRVTLIHFPRLRAQKEDEKMIFLQVLNHFQTKFPLDFTTDLVNDWNYFYERSIGCVGILKTLFDDVLNDALNSNKDCVKLEDFDKYAKSYEYCSLLLSDAVRGELMFQQSNSEKFKTALQQSLYSDYPESIDEIIEELILVPAKKKKGNNNNPFRSNPKRLEVGVGLR